MIYVIDGHNLIGKMPDIQLSDPDDEQKLVSRLSDWTVQDKRRKIKLYFDAGEFGGLGDMLSRPSIRVQFSRMGKTADSMIIKFMESIKNPQEFTLVTSDREIIYAARKKRIGYILSEEFVVLLQEDLKGIEPGEVKEGQKPAEAGAEEEVDVSDSEVKEWLNAFEKAPHREPDIHIVPLPSRKPKPNPTNDLEEAKRIERAKKVVDPDKLKDGESNLTKEDLAEWMAMFGDEEIRKKKEAEKPVVIPDPAAKRKKKPLRKKGEPVTRKFGEGGLSMEEVDNWLEIFDTEKKKK